jgi:hypothetical protein
VLDVVGVDRDGAFHVPGAFRLQVPLDQRDHLFRIHDPPMSKTT